MALKMMELSDEVVSPHGEPIKVVYFVVFLFSCVLGFCLKEISHHCINLENLGNQVTVHGEADFLDLWMRVLWSSKGEIEI